MESRYYPGVEAEVIKLMTELRSVFDEDFEVQTMQVSSTTVLQARKSSTLRDITGLSAALTIKVTPETGGTRVEIGLQKWFDKAAVAANKSRSAWHSSLILRSDAQHRVSKDGPKLVAMVRDAACGGSSP